MTCVQCNEKTLYDKTIARRMETASRRTKRTLASMAVIGLLATGSASSLGPANAAPDFSGFTTHAEAVPLRIEVHEPAIPVPSDPQFELNFSYTKVDGASGPIGTARSSALWPGDAVGEGLKTFGQQLSLPGALTDGGYPVQANAQTPGDTGSQTQEFFAGNVGTAMATDKQAIAKEGYGTTGDVSSGDLGTTGPAAPTLLDALKDPTLLSGILSGTKTGKPGDPAPGGSPLGLLNAVISVSGMESTSSTNYDPSADSVVATATSRLGAISLIGGLVKMTGVEVVTQTTSNIAGGAKTTQSVNVGGMSLAGQAFKFTGTGVVAAGKTTPIPGLPAAPAAALKALGISFAPGVVTTTNNGPAGGVTAEGVRITIDMAPLISKLPKLPLAELVSKFPDLPGQASILKGLIIALGDAHPRIDLVLGRSITSAQTVAGIGSNPLPPTGNTGNTGSTGGSTGSTGSTGSSVGSSGGGAPITTGSPGVGLPTTPLPGQGSTGIVPASSRIPPLGSVPMALILGGLLLAGGLGWYIKRAGSLLFGGGTTCTHGLTAGIPDLRKV
jgi:hypothetical protein